MSVDLRPHHCHVRSEAMTEVRKMAFALLLLSPVLFLHEGGLWGLQWAAARNGSPGEERAAQDVDLGGGWQAFLPAGFEQRVQLVPLGNNQYELKPKSLTFSGIYLRTGDSFQMVESSDGSPAGYVWKVRSRHLMTLVEQSSNVGSNYEGGILFRSADKKGK